MLQHNTTQIANILRNLKNDPRFNRNLLPELLKIAELLKDCSNNKEDFETLKIELSKGILKNE